MPDTTEKSQRLSEGADGHLLAPNLCSILQTPALGYQILQYVRYADLQRLVATNQTLSAVINQENQPYATIWKWLKNVEVLHCVPCPYHSVRQKMMNSLRLHPDRTRCMSHDSMSDSYDELSRNDIWQAYENYAWISFEPNLGSVAGFSFVTIPILMLQSSFFDDEDGQGEAFDLLNNNNTSDEDNDSSSCDENDSDDAQNEEDENHDKKGEPSSSPQQQQGKSSNDDANGQGEPKGQAVDDSSTDDDDEQRQSKRLKLLKCTSAERCCSGKEVIDRFFYIQKKPYCGYCLDHFDFLKLQFYAEHFDASSTDWRLLEAINYCETEDDQSGDDDSENENTKEPPDGWGLQDDEFRVQIFFIQPYESGDISFIGVGPRN